MRYIGSYSFEFRRQVFLRKIIFSFLIAIIALFIGLSITFLLVFILPGDPVLAYLPPSFTQPQYIAMYNLLGFNQPLYAQFFKFISDFFAGQWGISASISSGTPVLTLISERLPRMFELLLLPTIIGLVLGIMFGKIAIKFRKKWVDRIIQAIFAIGISIPILFLGLIFQYEYAYLGDLPALGYKTASFPNPPFVTGSRLIDSLISGQHYLFWDTVLHYILPGIALTIFITLLITRQTRASADKMAEEKSATSNTMATGMIFGLIFASYLLIETVFNLHGISELFFIALTGDYFLTRAVVSVIVILFILITFISNLIHSIIKSLSITNQNSFKDDTSLPSDNKPNQNQTLEPDTKRDIKNNLKHFVKELLINPAFLYGLVLVAIYAFTAIFPQAITPYSFDEANGIFAGSWAPPSIDHPFGQGKFGRDVLARAVWGARDALVFGFGAVLIALLGGVILGLIGSIHKWARIAILAVLIPILIIPSILLIPLTMTIIGRRYEVLLMIVGFLLTPLFARMIAKPPLRRNNVKPLLKKLVVLFPLVLALAILIYESIGFLGFYDSFTIQLGKDISDARLHMYDASYVFLWPGITLSFLIMGFVFLHQGLKHYLQTGSNRKEFEFF
ncbi:MAG: ABC transporter permease subunit [Promethearchaeota archaeon]|jgi:peptide/nickel transport system permease protein